MTSDLRAGDQVINISRHARRRGPFRIARVQDIEGSPRKLLHVIRENVDGKAYRSYMWPEHLVKLEPGQTVQQVLRAHVPPNQLCEICDSEPAPERHFVTVPLPRGFTRICAEDFAVFKRMLRERVKDDVRIVLQHIKDRVARKTP